MAANFRELLADHHISFEAVARRVGGISESKPISYRTLRRAILEDGRATPQEVQKLSEMLGISEEHIRAALAETVLRRGRDPRGRRSPALAGVGPEIQQEKPAGA